MNPIADQIDQVSLPESNDFYLDNLLDTWSEQEGHSSSSVVKLSRPEYFSEMFEESSLPTFSPYPYHEEEYEQEKYTGLRLTTVNSDENKLEDETEYFNTWEDFECCERYIPGRLLEFYEGYEWYQCFNKTKSGCYCTRKILTHPDYMRDIERDWSVVPYQHLPICGQCRRYLRNNDMAIPYPTEWRPAPKKLSRVNMATKEIYKHMPSFLDNGRFEALKESKIKRETRAINDSKQQRKPTGTPINATQLDGERTYRVQLPFVQLSPLLKQNRATYWNQFWYLKHIRDDMNYYDQFMEAGFYRQVFEISFINEIVIDLNMGGQSASSSKTPKFSTDEEELEFHYPLPPKISQRELNEAAEFLSVYPEFKVGTNADRRKIIIDYCYFSRLEFVYRNNITENMRTQYQQDVTTHLFHTPGSNYSRNTFYTPSKYLCEWNKSMPEIIDEIFDGFSYGTSFTNGNVSFAKVNSYMCEHIKAYKFMDWVMKFKVIRLFLEISRETSGKINRFPISSDSVSSNNYQYLPKPEHINCYMKDPRYAPQIMYVLSTHRNVLGPVGNEEQMDLLSEMPQFYYPEYWQFVNTQLVTFNPSYNSLSIVEQELVKRHFFCYASFILSCRTSDQVDIANILTMERYLVIVRNYITTTILQNVEEGVTLRNIANMYFTDFQIVNYKHFEFRALSIKSDQNLAKEEAKQFAKLAAKERKATLSHQDSKKVTKKQPVVEHNVWASKPNSQETKSASSSSSATTFILNRIQHNEDDDSPVHVKKVRKFFDSSKVFNRSYFMNDTNLTTLGTIDGKNNHVITDAVDPIYGVSLLSAIQHILTKYENNENTKFPTFPEMRAKLVEELLLKTKMEHLYFQSSNPNLLFRSQFIELMREDPEYSMALSVGQQRRGIILLSENEDEEIELYIKNKLKPEVELTVLDAIQLSMCFNMNAVVWNTTDSDISTAVRNDQFNIFTDGELHDTWIFIQDESTDVFNASIKVKKFLIRNYE